MYKLAGACCVAITCIALSFVQTDRSDINGGEDQLAETNQCICSDRSCLSGPSQMSTNELEAAIQGGRYDYKPNCLIYWSALWCASCQRVKPTIKQLQQDGFVVYFMDYTKNAALAKKNTVKTLPTTVILTGGKEVKRFTGLVTREEILKHLRKNKPDNYDIW